MTKNKTQSKVNNLSVKSDNNKYFKYAVYTLILIIILALIGANSFNLSAESELFDIKAGDLFTDNYGKFHIKTLHIDNNYFLPRSYLISRSAACLFNSESKKSTSLNLAFEDKDFYQLEAVEIGAYSKKDVKFYVNNMLPRKSPAPYSVAEKSVIDVQPVQEVDVDYDSILLIEINDQRDYIDCYSLSEEQIRNAEKVKII